nr:immunoglobulin light chain junction region [Macaca mulatta]
CTQSLEFPWMF